MNRADEEHVSLAELDRRIGNLEAWILTAGNALVRFYNPVIGVFWRDTFGFEKRDAHIHPTSTTRSFFALFEYLRFLHEDKPQDTESANRVASILSGVVSKYIGRLPSEPRAVRQSSANRINMFTDSHLLIAVSLLYNGRGVVAADVDVDAICDTARRIGLANIERLRRWKGGKVHRKDDVHDFVTLHAVRGIDAFFRMTATHSMQLEQVLRDRVRDAIIRLLSFHYAGVSARYDPAELAFSLALLNRFPTPEAPQLTERAILCVRQSQADDGGWPTSRHVSYEGHGLLHVASVEIALALTGLFIRKLYQNDFHSCGLLLPCLEKSFGLVRSHYNTVKNMTGWANDHARRAGLIESWTTAVVLTFLIHYRDALLQLRQCVTVQRYSANYKLAPPDDIAWPDMLPIFRNPSWIKLNELERISDPKDGAALTAAVKANVVGPIAENWVQRPRARSLILYGPSGTRKTSLVAILARTLQWPFIVIGPPHFLRKGGLEGFEDSAVQIFDDLMRLRRVVVLFDECEDLFKKRDPKQQMESRTVGAFITSGMLPRLQMLWDGGWIIFVLATNSDLDQLEPAVTRAGRFDYAENVLYPTEEAEVAYVRRVAPSTLQEAMVECIRLYERQRSQAEAASLSFSVLDSVITEVTRRALGGGPALSAQEILRILQEFVRRPGPRSLT